MTRFMTLPGRYAECSCGQVFRRGRADQLRCGRCSPAQPAVPPRDTPEEIRFFVPGNPVQWKRAKGHNRRVNDQAHTRWAGRVRDVAQAVVGAGVAYPAGPVRLGMLFALTPPPGTPVDAPAVHGHTPDLSNLVKLVEDAIQGVVYADDRQVVAYGDPCPTKVYTDDPHTVIVARAVMTLVLPGE